ncbi:MAG: hypothetical protein U0326_32780 [Polyangiales bacterium]
MKFSNEVWNVAESSNGSDHQLWLVSPEHPSSLANANNNADALFNLLSDLYSTPAKSGVLYFPPGRYYVGRPRTIRHWEASRLPFDADIQIPPGVTLRFAPGATLVPFNYGVDNEGDSRARAPAGRFDLRPEESFKVQIEIQGTIEAGIHAIFDAVLQSRAESASLGVSQLLSAGIIHLTRNNMREVHPEWWGAAPSGRPARVEDLLATDVRRTTMALQETIEVAHTRRSFPYVREAPNLVAIPIVLTGRYVIDQELQIGERWKNAELRRGAVVDREFVAAGPNPDPTRPYYRGGFVLRGARPPGRTGAGSATIAAHPTLFDENSDLSPGQSFRRVTPNSGALLGVRDIAGWRIENVTFDASFSASRCLTVHNPDHEAIQMIGVEGCEFKHARHLLVMLGGEELPPGDKRFTVSGKPFEGAPSIQYSSNTDMLGFRMVRCRFDTGDVDTWRVPTIGLLTGGETLPRGVACRAGNALIFAFRQCVFTGVAAPMVHDVEGGTSFVGCFFDTKWVTPPTLPIEPIVRPDAAPTVDTLRAGVDILLDASVLQYIPPEGTPPSSGTVSGWQSPPACFIKDCVSRSPMLVSNLRRFTSGNPTWPSVQLINVEHIPTIPPGDPLPPAILWAGATAAMGRLVLMGCRFVRPPTQRAPGSDDTSPLPFRQGEPVLFDLWAFATDLDFARGHFGTWATTIGGSAAADHAAVQSSRGHVIDMGNFVEGAWKLVSTALVEARLTALGATDPDRAKVHTLYVAERHHTIVLSGFGPPSWDI